VSRLDVEIGFRRNALRTAGVKCGIEGCALLGIAENAKPNDDARNAEGEKLWSGGNE
jgi:hypothetical protein